MIGIPKPRYDQIMATEDVVPSASIVVTTFSLDAIRFIPEVEALDSFFGGSAPPPFLESKLGGIGVTLGLLAFLIFFGVVMLKDMFSIKSSSLGLGLNAA